MKYNSLQQRVAELSATLLPISDISGTAYITEDMCEIAEDSNSFNSSFYCNGWIKPVFEGDFKGVLLQKVGKFQVMRMYLVCTRLEGLAYDEIPENWDDIDAPDFPEMEILDTIEYRQIWFNQSEQYTLVLNDEINDEYNDTYIVKVDSVQPWIFEPKYRQFIVDNVREYEYSYDTKPLAFFLSPVCELLFTKAPMFYDTIAECGYEDKAMRYYRSIRVAIRHGYRLPTNEQEARLYFDYLDMLNNKQLCLTEPRYVCPADFSAEYARLSEERSIRLREYQERMTQQQIEHEKKREADDILFAEQHEAEFADKHSWLFNQDFEDDNFIYQSLDSVEAYRLEGQTMHHCLFRCGYYEKHYMLALHISDLEGNRVATCTINLDKRKIDAIQPMCNDTGFFRTYGRLWQDTDDYKHIWNTLMARMHTFPCRHEEEQQTLNINIA